MQNALMILIGLVVGSATMYIVARGKILYLEKLVRIYFRLYTELDTKMKMLGERK